jgi:NAD(P)H dehydrogenase (quinone)
MIGSFYPASRSGWRSGKVKPAMTHIRKLGVVTTYGASWLRATLAGDPPRRLVTRAFRHAAKPDRLLYMALYDMNRADQAKRAGYLARVKHAMEQF